MSCTKRRVNRSLLRKGYDYIKESLTGVLPQYLRINKTTRIKIVRFRPTDIWVLLELKRVGGWTQVGGIMVDGTAGTARTETYDYMYPDEIRKAMTDSPGIVTKYV